MIRQEYRFSKRSILDKISEYRFLIIFITLIFVAATVFYVTVSDKVYRSKATVEIVPKETHIEATKINPVQNSDYERYFQTQMDFLHSRYLVTKVVKNTNSNVKFFVKNAFGIFKSISDEPPIKIEKFDIKDKAFFSRYFYIEILDDDSYQLSLVKDKVLKKELTEPLVCNFGDTIVTNVMDFRIQKSDFNSHKGIYIKVIPEYIEVDKAIDRLDIVRISDKSSFVQLSYDDNSAYGAKNFLENLIDTYKSILNKTQKSQEQNYSEVIDEEIKKVKEKLDENEKKLLEFSTKNQTSGITKQTDNIVNSIYKEQERLKELEIKYQTLRTVLVMVKDINNYENILTLLDDIDSKNLSILINSILEEEKIYQKNKEKYTDKHPKMIELKRSITTRKIALKRNLIELFKSLKKQKEELQNSINTKQESLKELPSKEIGLAQLQREHEQLEKRYLSLIDKRSKLKLSQKIDSNYILRVVDAPYMPTYHIKPKGKVLVGLAFVLGLLVGILTAFVIDFFRKKIVVPSDIEENTFIPLLATIAKIKDKKLYHSLFVIKEPQLLASKMIWELRNAIESYKNKKSGTVIAVTSLIRGEGKSTICANLAAALSQGDKSVIVVSLDLRLPQIHNLLGMKNRFGITSVMYDKVDINNVIKRVKGFENLYFLPTGPLPNSPMKVINSKFMERLFKELRNSFDYVVVDLAPISVAPETLFILKNSDLNLMILKSNYSDKRFLMMCEDIVKKNGIKNIAFVLNALSKKYVNTITRKENQMYMSSKEILTSNF